jgi:hypothetical protein
MEFSDFFGDIWSFDINYEGTELTAVSSDLSIRVYQLSDEQTYPELEKEKQLDKNLEDELEKDLGNTHVNILNKDIDLLVPIKKSLDNIGLAEDLVDGLDVAEKYKSEVYQYEIALEEYNVNHNNIEKS